MDPKRQQRLIEVSKIATALEAEFGVPAKLLIAQWATESRWGTRPIGNNYFGIKRADQHEKFTSVKTKEVFSLSQLSLWNRRHPDTPAKVIMVLPDGRFQVEVTAAFADYNSLEESCRDYAWLISHGDPYSEAWQDYQQDKDVECLIQGVARVYATDPNYATLISRIANQPNVAQALELA